MKTWVFIGIFDQPHTCQLYIDPAGVAPKFSNYSQADQYIRQNRLLTTVSPIEVSEYELPDRNQG